MLSNFVIALMLGGGIGFWSYTRFLRSSGNNAKNSAIGAGITAVLIVIIVTIVLQIVFKHLKK